MGKNNNKNLEQKNTQSVAIIRFFKEKPIKISVLSNRALPVSELLMDRHDKNSIHVVYKLCTLGIKMFLKIV